MTTEDALWLTVGANPADSLPRLVLADWLEERAGVVVCDECGGRRFRRYHAAGVGMTGPLACKTCAGYGYVSDGRADTAAALRATADLVPSESVNRDSWSWILVVSTPPHLCSITAPIFGRLTGLVPPGWPSWRDYPTALDALRDLCRAWVAVNLGGG